MVIEMFNFWYWFFMVLTISATVGLYFLLRRKKPSVQKIVLFSLLALGLVLHFLKLFIPPYSTDSVRLLNDSWFINICAANIALFPFMFWSKKKVVKDYMFYIGVLTGLIIIFYPQEALGRPDDQILDVIRFYYHHWIIMAVPLMMVLLKLHTLSWRRVGAVPISLLLVMLFIILNQFFQSELGFTQLRGAVDKTMGVNGEQYILTEFAGDPIKVEDKQYVLVDYWESFRDVDWKNSSYIYSPNFTETSKDPIGQFFDTFCPETFKTVPAGPYEGQTKFWPWFWIICPVFILVTPLSFGLAMIFDHKNFIKDLKRFTWRGFLALLISPLKKIKARIFEDDKAVKIIENAEDSLKEVCLDKEAVAEEVL